MPLSTIYHLYCGGYFLGEKTADLPQLAQVTDKLYKKSCIEDTLPRAGIKLSILVVIGTN